MNPTHFRALTEARQALRAAAGSLPRETNAAVLCLNALDHLNSILDDPALEQVTAPQSRRRCLEDRTTLTDR